MLKWLPSFRKPKEPSKLDLATEKFNRAIDRKDYDLFAEAYQALRGQAVDPGFGVEILAQYAYFNIDKVAELESRLNKLEKENRDLKTKITTLRYKK